MNQFFFRRKIYLYLMAFAISACNNGNTQVKTSSPEGYDLSQPVKYELPEDLLEVSGISFYPGQPGTLYAEQDEQGHLYWLKPGDKKASNFQFGKSGDYEDLAFISGQAVLLRSDGTLFSFSFKGEPSIRNPKDVAEDQLKEWKDLVPEGEYESLYADPATNTLYILCKKCSGDKKKEQSTGYELSINDAGVIERTGEFAIQLDGIRAAAGETKSAEDEKGKKGKKDGLKSFRPSALTRNPATNEWYILSSINKMLVVADDNWAVKEVHPLNSSLFPQPEGITFDGENNLYISNEGSKSKYGNVLKFTYEPKK